MNTTNLSVFAPTMITALDTQRSGAMVVNLLLVKLQIGQPTLTTGDCWTLVGGAGKATKKDAQRYFRANSLQRSAKEISDVLQNPASTDWDKFATKLQAVDFTSAELLTSPAFEDVMGFMALRGCHAVNGRDVRDFLITLRPASEQPAAGTAQGTEQQPETATGKAPDTVSAEAGQAAGDIEAEKDLAAAMLADLAVVDDIIGKTVAGLLTLDPTIALQKLAQAWQADRKRLLAEINKFEAEAETERKSVEVRAKQLAKQMVAAQTKAA